MVGNAAHIGSEQGTSLAEDELAGSNKLSSICKDKIAEAIRGKQKISILRGFVYDIHYWWG